MLRTLVAIVALMSAALLTGPAHAQNRVAAGSLTCDVSAGLGLIIGSRREVACTFTPSRPGPLEFYNGYITKVGLDVGVTAGGVMVWLVFAPTNRNVGELAGNYVGASADPPGRREHDPRHSRTRREAEIDSEAAHGRAVALRAAVVGAEDAAEPGDRAEAEGVGRPRVAV